MPIITTFVTTRSLPDWKPSKDSIANHSWPMISAALRSRWKPCLPVEQNLQSRLQPTCEDTHSVARLPSGISTVSTSAAATHAHQPLARAVRGVVLAGHLRWPDLGDLGQARAQALGQVGHRREIAHALVMNPFHQLLGAVALFADRLEPRLEPGPGHAPARFVRWPLPASGASALLAMSESTAARISRGRRFRWRRRSRRSRAAPTPGNQSHAPRWHRWTRRNRHGSCPRPLPAGSSRPSARDS
jgi:hypothetical protein